MNNAELHAAYIKTLESRAVSPHTIIAYKHSLDRLVEFAAERPILELKIRELRNFLMAESENGSGPPAISIRVAALKNFSRHYQGIGKHPMQQLSKPKHKSRLPDVLTVSEVGQLIEACPNLRDKTLVELAYATGCRAAELCSIKLRDITMADGEIRVLGKGNKERLVLFGRPAHALLTRWLAERNSTSEYLFPSSDRAGHPITTRTVGNIVENAAKLAGLKHVHPHTLRHSMASHMVEHGADIRFVQELLGHANVKQTAQYLSLSIQHLCDVHTRCFKGGGA